MDRAGELVRQHGVDGALAVQAGQSGQLAGGYFDVKMALPAIGRAGVPGMQRALIGDSECLRRKRLAQFCLYS